ncbi:hypothetical protein OG520_21020 [Streptomyces sp. NBC_00984]|uniref:hypothetical protein n=1 Tax=Streptomyces sp. NBC_00984 TaxID=2903700 RepID=UPI00386B2AA3|nr:hypothetical protein OG520_21020 [Streptomyces sp. NBC_00984]
MRPVLLSAACLAAGGVLALAPSTQGVGTDTGGEPQHTVIMSNEEFEQRYGPAVLKGADEHGAVLSQEQFDRAADRQRIAYSDASVTEPAEQVLRASNWSTVKFKAKDLNGKTIPTRVGNSALGWRHFSQNTTSPTRTSSS